MALSTVLRSLAPATLLAFASAPGSAQVEVRQSPGISTLNGFVENRGQWDPEVLFFARRGGIDATLTADALVFRPAPNLECEEPTPAPLVLRLPKRGEVVRGVDAVPTLHHFILASGSASNVRGYESVVYEDVQPGLDVRMRFDGPRFAYDLLLDAGVELGGFALEVAGAQGIEVAGRVLRLQTEAGVVEQTIGASWQEDASGAREPVEATFRMLDPDGALSIGFEVSERDASRALVIDPSLTWATYVGGPNQELLLGMGLDDQEAVYLLCTANTGGTPTTPGALFPDPTPPGNLWVGKLSADGSSLEWATFLGGSDSDQDGMLEVDGEGGVVIAGRTWSADFPVTEGSFQTVHGGNAKSDIFVTRLDARGALVWSTFVGKTVSEKAGALGLAPDGDVLVAGYYISGSDPLPATPGAFDPVYDEDDGFLFRLSADGSTLEFLTYYLTEGITDIAVGADYSIYFAGGINELDAPFLPTPGAFQDTFSGTQNDAFVTKMDPNASSVVWATLLGGAEGSEAVWALTLDPTSSVYVAGQTNSDDFPTTTNAFDPTLTGSTNGFVAKLLPGGSGLAWSTYLGQTCDCGGSGYTTDVAVDAAGNAHAGGWANGPGWPTTPDAFQLDYIGPFPRGDAALTKLDALGEQLIYSTWFGGDGGDGSTLVALGSEGSIHLALESFAQDIPVNPGVYQSQYSGSQDLVVAEFELPQLPWRLLGGGLSGLSDTPNLVGLGWLTPGSPARIALRGGFPNSIAIVFVGFSTLELPFLGGTLVPWPDVWFSLPTDAQGALDIPLTWPELTPGSSLWFQMWVLDPGAPEFFSASNGLQAISQ